MPDRSLLENPHDGSLRRHWGDLARVGFVDQASVVFEKLLWSLVVLTTVEHELLGHFINPASAIIGCPSLSTPTFGAVLAPYEQPAA